MFQQQAATAVLLWVVYVAIEPFARRFWPDGLLGWSRLPSGRVPAIGVALMGVFQMGNIGTPWWLGLTIQALVTALIAGVVLRFGLLAAVVAFFIFELGGNIPLTLHTSVWWATPSNLTLAMFATLAAFGFYASRAGQPLFGAMQGDHAR